VFGACGFLGRLVARRLLQSGAQVLGIDTKPWPGATPAGYAHSGDGAAALAMAATFLKAQTDTLIPPKGAAGQGASPLGTPQGGPAGFFHLAGLADAGTCQRDPELAKRLNVDLVVEALAALSGVRCAFVFPSTGIVYGDRLGRPAREDDPLLPAAEYARGKIAAEGLVRAASSEGPLRGAVARLSNIYGPGGGENTVLGRLLAQARRGEPLRVFDESPVRDFLHVDDAAEGLVRMGLAALAGDSGQALTANLSTGVGTSVGALVDLCAELFHSSRLAPERQPDPRAHVSSLVLDNARLRALTGWRPSITLRQGLPGSINT
jgi:UDP-glucose 4-epimerase